VELILNILVKLN